MLAVRDKIELIKELFDTFSYPRVNRSNIISAGKTIKNILENNGYQVIISKSFCKNIETDCKEPGFIITAHYDSPFFFHT